MSWSEYRLALDCLFLYGHWILIQQINCGSRCNGEMQSVCILLMSRSRDPSAIIALGYASAFISSNLISPSTDGKKKSQEVRPECRLLDPILESAAMWFGQISLVGWVSLVPRSGFCIHTVTAAEYPELLGVIMSSIFRCKYKRNSPHMIPPKICKTTFKNPNCSAVSERAGPSWFQPTPNQKRITIVTVSLCKHSPQKWANNPKWKTNQKPSHLITEV